MESEASDAERGSEVFPELVSVVSLGDGLGPDARLVEDASLDADVAPAAAEALVKLSLRQGDGVPADEAEGASSGSAEIGTPAFSELAVLDDKQPGVSPAEEPSLGAVVAVPAAQEPFDISQSQGEGDPVQEAEEDSSRPAEAGSSAFSGVAELEQQQPDVRLDGERGQDTVVAVAAARAPVGTPQPQEDGVPADETEGNSGSRAEAGMPANSGLAEPVDRHHAGVDEPPTERVAEHLEATSGEVNAPEGTVIADGQEAPAAGNSEEVGGLVGDAEEEKHQPEADELGSNPQRGQEAGGGPDAAMEPSAEVETKRAEDRTEENSVDQESAAGVPVPEQPTEALLGEEIPDAAQEESVRKENGVAEGPVKPVNATGGKDDDPLADGAKADQAMLSRLPTLRIDVSDGAVGADLPGPSADGADALLSFRVEGSVDSAASNLSPRSQKLMEEFHLSKGEVESLHMVFHTFDEDGGGSIDLQEMLSVLKMLGMGDISPGDVRRMFKDADEDNSGSIDFHEFCAMISHLSGSQGIVSDSHALDIINKKYFDRTPADIADLAKWCVKKQPFFSQFQMPVVLEFCRHLHTRRVKAGEWLVRQGEDAGKAQNAMFCILAGAGAVFQRFEDDNPEAVVPSRAASPRPGSSSQTASPRLLSRSNTLQQENLAAERSGSSLSDAGPVSPNRRTAGTLAGAARSLQAAPPASPKSPQPRKGLKLMRGKLSVITEQLKWPDAPQDAAGTTTPSPLGGARRVPPNTPLRSPLAGGLGGMMQGMVNTLMHGQPRSPSPTRRRTCLPATPEHHTRAQLLGDYQILSIVDEQSDMEEGDTVQLQNIDAANGRVMGIMRCGDYVGLSNMLHVTKSRACSVMALQPTEVMVIDSHLFNLIMDQQPKFAGFRPSHFKGMLSLDPHQRPATEIAKLALLLNPLPVFQGIEPKVLEKIVRNVSVEDFPTGSVIVRQGRPGDVMYIVLKGRCNLHEKHNLEEELGLVGTAKQTDGNAPTTPTTPTTPYAGGARQSISEKANAVSAAIRNRRSKISSNKTTTKIRVSARSMHNDVTAESVLKAHNMAALLFQDSTLIEQVQPDIEDPVQVEDRLGEIVDSLIVGDTFGEIAMLEKEGKHRRSVRAAEPVFLVTVNREVYQQTIAGVREEEVRQGLHFLKQCPVMEGVTGRSLQAVNFELVACEQNSGYCFFMQGAPATGIFIIQEGHVKVYKQRMPPEKASAKSTSTLPKGYVFGLPQPNTQTAAKEDDDATASTPRALSPSPSARRPKSGKGEGSKGEANPPAKDPNNSADGKLSLAYVKTKLVQVAELGPRDFFGEDCLPDGVHSCTVIASGHATVLWLRPDAVHHLGSRGISNLMRAADLRSRWRAKQAEVMQANWHLAQAAGRDNPILSSRTRSRAIQSARSSGSGDGGANAIKAGAGTGVKTSGRPDSTSTAQRNAETAMRSTMHLSRWAEELEASKVKQTKARSACGAPSPPRALPAAAGGARRKGPAPPRSARAPVKRGQFTRRPATAGPVLPGGGVRSSVAKGEVKVAAGSVTDTLNDSIQEASWALNFCVRGSLEVESTRGAEELLQWRMDSELPVDIMDRHAEREGDLRASLANAPAGMAAGSWAPPVVVHSSGPGAVRGRKLSLSTSLDMGRPNTAPAATYDARPLRPGSPTRRTDDLARPWSQGGAAPSFEGGVLPSEQRSSEIRSSMLRRRMLAGKHAEYSPVRTGTAWGASGQAGYNAHIRSTAAAPYESLQGPLLTRSQQLEAQMMGPAHWTVRRPPVASRSPRMSASHLTHSLGLKIPTLSPRSSSPSRPDASRPASGVSKAAGAPQSAPPNGNRRPTMAGHSARSLQRLQYANIDFAAGNHGYTEHVTGGCYGKYVGGNLKGNARPPPGFRASSPTPASDFPDVELLERRIAALANTIHVIETEQPGQYPNRGIVP